MKTCFFYFLLFLSFSTNIFSQNILKGSVIDATTKEPMDFVTVFLIDPNKQTPPLGGATNQQGVFVISKIPAGNYTLRIQFVGYSTYIKSLQFSKTEKTIDLGVIALKENTTALKDVEVIGQSSQMKLDIDKRTFTVDQNIAAAGGNITEVLQNIPSVDVDAQGNISLRNNANVEVWINGKPAGLTEENRAQILQQMPANSIQSVEIITNPSAKYSPEGTAGIINLVMKKDNKGGCFGNVTAGLLYPIGVKLGETAGVYVNYNKGKFESYFNIGIRNSWQEDKSMTKRYYLTNNDTTSVLTQTQDILNNMYGLSARLGITYHLSDKHSIGFSGFGIGGNGLFSATSKDTLETENPLFSYERTNIESGSRYMGNATVDYLWEMDKKGSELRSSLSVAGSSFNWDIAQKKWDYSSNEERISLMDQKQVLGISNNRIQFKTDFVKKISENNKVEVGVDIKNQTRTSSATAQKYNESTLTYVDEPSMYNDFTHEQLIMALYGTYSHKIGKFSFQGGLRGEYFLVSTSTKSAVEDVQTVAAPNFQLYPTFFLAYSATKTDEFQLNYTRRVDRPGGRKLNSFRNYSDSTNISYGNPNLSPEYMGAFELNYIKTYGKRKNQILSSSLYYRYTDNVIQDVRFINNGLMNTTFMNISQSQSSGLELISKNTLSKFLNLTSTLNVYYYTLTASDYLLSSTQTIHVTGSESFSWNARILANFMLSNTFSGQVAGNYSSPKVIAQGTTEGNYSFDFGLRKTFFNRTLTAALSARDILNTKRQVRTTSGENFSQYSESYSIGPTINLTLTYNFGKGDKKKIRVKGKDNQGIDDNINEVEKMEE